MSKISLYLTASWCLLSSAMAMETLDDDKFTESASSIIAKQKQEFEISLITDRLRDFEQSEKFGVYSFLKDQLQESQEKIEDAKQHLALFPENPTRQAAFADMEAIFAQAKLNAEHHRQDSNNKIFYTQLDDEYFNNRIALAHLLKDSTSKTERGLSSTIFEESLPLAKQAIRTLSKYKNDVSTARFLDLCRDNIENIYQFLELKDLSHLRMVDKKFHDQLRNDNRLASLFYLEMLKSLGYANPKHFHYWHEKKKYNGFQTESIHYFLNEPTDLLHHGQALQSLLTQQPDQFAVRWSRSNQKEILTEYIESCFGGSYEDLVVAITSYLKKSPKPGFGLSTYDEDFSESISSRITNRKIKFNAGEVVLNKRNSKIKKIPSILNDLENLARLDLSENMINYMSDSFRFEHLKILDLSNNQLQTFPDFILNCENLESIDIHGNQIVRLPYNISKLKKLYYLNVSSNSIDRIPNDIISDRYSIDEFPSLYTYRTENSFYWELKNIMKSEYSFVLNLTNNKIKILPEGFASQKFTSINLGGNPIDIDDSTTSNEIDLLNSWLY